MKDMDLNLITDNKDFQKAQAEYQEEKERLAQEAFNKAWQKSCINNCKEAIRREKDLKEIFLVRCSAVLLTVALTVGVCTLAHEDIEKELSVFDAVQETSYLVTDSTFRVNNNEDYAYNHQKIAEDILNYQGSWDLDSVIFTCYNNFSYDVTTQMNELFSSMKNIIDKDPTKYSENVRKACYYSNFDDYLTSHSFNSIREYKLKMKEIINAYSNILENQELINGLYNDTDESFRR